MKKVFKLTLASVLALLMSLCLLPVSAQTSFEAEEEDASPCWNVPSGYNAHDYGKCAEFLEQTDENGVKNGEKLSAAYDVNDPSSWGNLTFQWAQRNGEMRIWNIALWQYQGLVGRMDMSNCSSLFSLDFMENDITEVDVSGCRELMYLDCSGNELTELDVSDSVDMLFLYCDTNRLTSLDVSMLTDLEELDCYDNGLTELDVSNSPNLEALYCTGNLFTELDLSNNPKLGLDLITVDGSGHIGYRFLIDNGELHARPANGASFEGFFNENGDLLDEGFFIEEDDAFVYYLSDLEDGDIIARFSGGAPAPVPGDVDGNGSVTVSDAVTALRIAMELFDGNGFNLDNADMDGNESITIADAVVILRIAMGLA